MHFLVENSQNNAKNDSRLLAGVGRRGSIQAGIVKHRNRDLKDIHAHHAAARTLTIPVPAPPRR